MNNIILSVIIPVYNAENYLDECLDSIYNQYIKNIEVICVNDGSTDNSGKVLEDYKKNKQRDLIIYTKPNGGLATSRNAGYRLAKGKYIYYLDNDDYLLPEGLHKMLTIAEKENLDIVCFNSQIGDNKYYFNNRTEVEAKSGKEYYLKYYHINGFFPPKTIWMHLYRKDLFDRNNLLFKDGLDIEDEHFSPRAFYLAKKVKGFNIPVVFHRVQRQNSIMQEHHSGFKPKYIRDLMDTCSDIYSFYQEKNNDEKILLLDLFGIYLSIAKKISMQNKNYKKDFFNVEHFRLMKNCAISWEWYTYYWLFRYNSTIFKWYISEYSSNAMKKILNRIFRISYPLLWLL